MSQKKYDNAESLPALMAALKTLEDEHALNPAMPQLREILLKRIAAIEKLQDTDGESSN